MPIRSCRVCRTRKPQAELQRWTRVDGKLVADSGNRAAGRGVYSCSDGCAVKLR